MKWKSTSNDERMLMAKKMAHNAEKHLDLLASAGLTQEKLDNMKQLIADIDVQRLEQHNLKCLYHDKTKEVSDNMKKLYDEYYSVTKKMIKQEYTNPMWKIFGIEDIK